MHKAIIYIATVCIVAVSTLSLAAQTTGNSIVATVSNATDERYRIGFQDTLEIQVFRRPELTVRQVVSPAGTIRLYRLDKPIVAACKTERELATAIEDAYRVSYLKDPQVTVVVAEQKSQPISVIGAVEKAGSYYVGKKMHLLEILAMAGGPNKEAGTRLLVARAGTNSNCRTDNVAQSDDMELFNFKLRDVQEGKKTLRMEPGDIVSVLSADYVYVYGNVMDPGQLIVREPITLTQAIASSKGLKPATDKGDVRILRQKADSLERDEILVDLSAIEKGKAKDPYLEPNDIVAVSKDGSKAIVNGIVKTIQNGVPSIFARGF